MRMPRHVYESLYDDILEIIRVMDETGRYLIWDAERLINPDDLTMRDMWDLLLTINIDRSNEDHPRHHSEVRLGRALEFDDRSPHWIYSRENGDLDDSHIKTALNRIREEIIESRLENSLAAAI
jgi:hypothetical protein